MPGDWTVRDGRILSDVEGDVLGHYPFLNLAHLHTAELGQPVTDNSCNYCGFNHEYSASLLAKKIDLESRSLRQVCCMQLQAAINKRSI